MDEKKKFNYDYNNGGQVENQYIYDIDDLLVEFNEYNEKVQAQKDSYERLLKDIENSKNEYSDERIKEQYSESLKKQENSFYYNSPSAKTYDQFVADMKEYESKQLADLKREYDTDLYFLDIVQTSTKQNLNKKRKELEKILKETEIKLMSIDITNRKEYDETFLETKKLEHAISYIDELINKLNISKEQGDLLLKGHTEESDHYEEIVGEDLPIKKKKETEDDDDEKTADDELGEISLDKYYDYLYRYDMLLDSYANDFDQYLDCIQKLNNKEITYDQYLEYAKNLGKKYEDLMIEYNRVSKMYNKLMLKDDINKEALLSPDEPTKLSGVGKNEEEELGVNSYYDTLDEYDILLNDYETEYDNYVEVTKEYNNGEITYEEYSAYADEILEKYKNIKSAYDNIKKLYDKTVEEVTNGLSWHPGLTINDINELKSRGINEPKGEEYNKYLEEHGLSIEEIRAPKGPTKFSALGEVCKIEHQEKNPKITWKTIALMSAGAGLGIGLALIPGTAGWIIGVASQAAFGFAKKAVEKKRTEARMKRLNGEVIVEEIKPSSSKLKNAANKFKNYINSEEGLRDISYAITTEMVSYTVTKIAKTISDLVKSSQNTGDTTKLDDKTQQPDDTTKNQGKTVSENVDDISGGKEPEYEIHKMSDPDLSVGEQMNVSNEYGYTNTYNASGMENPVHLDTTYGQNSVVNQIRVGNTQYSSVSEALSQGHDLNDISVRLNSADGDPYAWFNASDIIGGKVR